MIGIIRADDLDRWASRITTAPEFPRLVRLLVHATAQRQLMRLATRSGVPILDTIAPVSSRALNL